MLHDATCLLFTVYIIQSDSNKLQYLPSPHVSNFSLFLASLLSDPQDPPRNVHASPALAKTLLTLADKLLKLQPTEALASNEEDGLEWGRSPVATARTEQCNTMYARSTGKTVKS